MSSFMSTPNLSGTNLPPLPIDYTNRDYQSILTALKAAAPTFMPEWTSTSVSDFGQALLGLFAYQADILNYYLDRVSNESFLQTCEQLASALEIAALIGYMPTQATPASAQIQLILNSGPSYPFVLPKASQFTTPATTSTPAVIFETAQSYTFTAAGTYLVDSNSNVLTVIQGQTVTNELIGVSNGQANQTFNLYNQPVIAGSVSVFVDQGLGPKLWRAVTSLATAQPTDLVYQLSTDENGVTWVSFGDGYNGAIPAASPNGITATYRVGGGAAGNVGVGQISIDSTGTTGYISSVTNLAVASGGQDPETIAEIQVNAPQSIASGNRGVSLADYAALALQVPSVAKAVATGLLASNVSLYVHPSTSPLPTTSLVSQVAGLAAAVQTYMANLIAVGSSVTVLPPQWNNAVAVTVTTGYVPIAIAVIVNVLPQYSPFQIQQDVMAAIDNLLDFTTTDFGQYISQSGVYQAIKGVPGVAFCNLTCMCRYEYLTDNTSGQLAGPVNDIVCAAYEIPVVVDPNLATTLVQVTPIGGS